MALHRFQKGELGHWLRLVADNSEPDTAQVDVPDEVAKALVTLRCVQVGPDGRWLITEKGKLALLGDQPAAIRAHLYATQGHQRLRDFVGHVDLSGIRLGIVGDKSQPMTQFALLETMQCHA